MNDSNVTAGRDKQGWSVFTSQHKMILSDGLNITCFFVVWAGSIYGLKEWFKIDSSELGFVLAAVAAFLIQRINAVCVHYSTRMLAALFAIQKIKSNKYQTFGGSGAFIGIVCLVLTSGICYFDYTANHDGTEAMVNEMIPDAVEAIADANPHEKVVFLALNALNAEKEAERMERAAHNTAIDAEINRKRRELESRRRVLTGKSWGDSELKQIENKLASLETQRKDRKNAFQPKTTNVAGKQKEYSDVSGVQAALLSSKQAEVDTSNSKRKKRVEEKKESRKGSLMIMYWLAMTLWHVSHGFRSYRSFLFDEIHNEDNNPIIAIYRTLAKGFNNLLWKLRAWIYDKLPEDEIEGITKTKLLEGIQSQVCADVFGFILANGGVKEMLLFITMKEQKGHSLEKVRHSLRLLKTGKLIFEASEMWRADESQRELFENAGFVLENFSVKKNEKIPENPAQYSAESNSFEGIKYRINMLRELLDVTPAEKQPQISYRITMLENILTV